MVIFCLNESYISLDSGNGITRDLTKHPTHLVNGYYNSIFQFQSNFISCFMN